MEEKRIIKTELELIFNYDFDPEEGYTQKHLATQSNEWAIYENPFKGERKLMINLYPEDIKALLEGTGVDLDEI